MVNKRRVIQEAYERFTVHQFLNYFNRCHHTQFRVIAEPNPPEAIIQSAHTTRWVEVTTAFWSEEFAKELYSAASGGAHYMPVSDDLFIEPDAQFAAQFASVIKKKLEHASYEAVRDQYGRGYLLVSIQYPLFGAQTFHFMRRALADLRIHDRACFRSAYLIYEVAGSYQVTRWRLPQ
ncbi:MAG: hypothetical protein KGM99_10240 [Burkholderiales bacterium]|nr:hypothetical protein [Burkholderiales bacterium]